MKPILKSRKLDNVCYDIRGETLEHAKRLEDEGHRVIFEKHGGYIEHVRTGQRTSFKRSGGVYTMDVKIMPNKDFQRQGM